VNDDSAEGAPPPKRQKTDQESKRVSEETRQASTSTNTSTSTSTVILTATTPNPEEQHEAETDGRKKKKEYKAKSSYIGDDEFEDILATGWYYLDSGSEKQGPFTTKEMKEWFVAGFFDDDLMIKRINESDFRMIKDRSEFQNLERRPQDQVYVPLNTFQAQQQLSTAPNPYYQEAPSYYDPAYEESPSVSESTPPGGDYSQKAFFTTMKGRFSASDQESYWQKKGLPTDKDGRMLSNYFDYDAYQEQMRNAKPPEKKKVSKAQIKTFRKKKEDKKRRRILMM